MKELRYLDEFIERVENIYIYGAGLIGNRYRQYILTHNNCKFKGFVVSEKDKACLDKNILWVGEITASGSDGVIVAMQQIPFDVKKRCFRAFHANIFFVYPQMNISLLKWQKRWLSSFCEDTNLYNLKYYDGIEPESLILQRDGTSLFRIYRFEKEEQVPLLEGCSLQRFEKEYGKLKILPESIKQDAYSNDLVEMYIATSHLDEMDAENVSDNRYLVPIQVGAVLTDKKKKCISDDTGDNISLKNRDYCETTALYWIWKNTGGQDYVGLEHYRRRMPINKMVVSSMYENNVDVLMPIPQFAFDRNIDFIFVSLVTPSDWDVVKKCICDYDRNYEEILSRYEKSFFYFSCNITLMKRTYFDDYCKFAFAIAEGLEEHYRRNNITRRDDRYMGFIFEHLLSIYLMKNFRDLNVYCTSLEWCV